MLKLMGMRVLKKVFKTPVFQADPGFDYQATLDKHHGNLPELSPTDRTIINALKSEGVFITSLDELSIPSTPLILHAAKRLLPRIPTLPSTNSKEYVVHATSAQLMEYPELFLWGLEERLLDIIENYFRLPVAYHGLYFRRDIVNKVQIKSRNWHIDTQNRHVLKVIVYLNDINDNCGPFQYISKNLTSSSSQSLKYKRGYLQDKAMQQVVPVSDWKSCLGPSGTVVFADTSNVFHRGKVPTASDRFTLFFDYTSRWPKHSYDGNFFFSKDELLVLSERLSQRQKQCVFWKEGLCKN